MQENVWMNLLQNILITLLTGLVGILIPIALNWLKQKLLKLSQDQLEFVQQAALLFVQAAEGLGLNELIEDKKEWVMAQLELYLEQHGVKIDIDAIDAAVEAAVFEQFNDPLLPPITK